MNAYLFSLFKRADRSCYSVSFKDEAGKYLRPVSTGIKTEDEALQAAFKMIVSYLEFYALTKIMDITFKIDEALLTLDKGLQSKTMAGNMR